MRNKIKNFATTVTLAAVYFSLQSSVCLAAPEPKSQPQPRAESGNSKAGASNSTSASTSASTSNKASTTTGAAAGFKKASSRTKSKLSAEQAVALVKKRSDVKKFLALFPNGKSKQTKGFPVVEAEELDKNWNVHVYEQMPDHTATMNWFEVDSQTGAIKPMN